MDHENVECQGCGEKLPKDELRWCEWCRLYKRITQCGA